MTPWQRVKCALFGRCDVPADERIQPIVDLMEEGLKETRGIHQELKQMRESGIWHQDLIEGRYRPTPRAPRKGHRDA